MVYSTNLYFKILFYYNTYNNHIYKIYTQSKQRKVTKGQSEAYFRLELNYFRLELNTADRIVGENKV